MANETDNQENNTTGLTHQHVDDINKMVNVAIAAAHNQPTSIIGPKPADLTKIFNKRIQRAVKERLITVGLVEDLRDNRIKVSVFQFDKFSIVELEFMNLHYHGLSSRNPADEPNAMEGVGRAYTRALNELFSKRRFGNLKTVKVLDYTGVVPVSKEIFEAMMRGTC